MIGCFIQIINQRIAVNKWFQLIHSIHPKITLCMETFTVPRRVATAASSWERLKYIIIIIHNHNFKCTRHRHHDYYASNLQLLRINHDESTYLVLSPVQFENHLFVLCTGLKIKKKLLVFTSSQRYSYINITHLILRKVSSVDPRCWLAGQLKK